MKIINNRLFFIVFVLEYRKNWTDWVISWTDGVIPMGKNIDKEKIQFPDKITRSNELITSKFSSTLVENKLMVLSLKKARFDEMGRPIATITTEEIRELTGVRGNSLYRTLRNAAARMIGRTLYLENKEPGSPRSFKFLNLIHYAEFKDGLFTVAFTPETKNYISGLKSNFTTMSIPILFKFSRNGSFRCYEILKSHAYMIDKKNNPYAVNYSLSQLKMELNCVNLEESKIKHVLISEEDPDFDHIVNNLAIEKKFSNWTDFRRRILDPAMKEICEVSDLFCTYEPIRAGLGGKIRGVRFYIQRNVGQDSLIWNPTEDENENPAGEMEISPEMQRSMMIDLVKKIISDISISDKDAIVLLKASDNDLDKIEASYELAKKQPHIKNFIGWMKKAIEEGYEEPIPTVRGDQDKAEKLQKIQENYSNNIDNLAEESWNRLKIKDNFRDFMYYIESEYGLDTDTFEILYDAKERMKLYGDWFRNRKK